MKKILSVLLIVFLLLGVFTVSAFAAKEQFLVINTAKISGVVTPIVGEKPSNTATSEESGKYNVAKVFWSEYDKDFEHVKDMGENDKFREGYYYFVFINLEAKSAYTFSNNMTQTINEKSANKYTPSDGGKKVQVYTHFESKKAISKVDLSVVKPVVGKTPTFAKVDTKEYYSDKVSGISNMTNGVYWRNEKTGVNITVNNPFKADGVYTVCYAIFPKDGYAFNENSKFTINGQQAVAETVKSADGKQGVAVSLKGLIPGDGKKEIATLDLSVTAPKQDEKPTYTKIDGTGYYSDNGSYGASTKIYKNGIAWFKSSSSYIGPGTTETFKKDTEYTVKILLLSKEGYKFAKNLTAKINGKTAMVETFDDGSIVLSAKLTTIGKDHKHTDSAYKNDEQNHWKVCTDCGTITVEKQMHKDENKDDKCDICSFDITKKENDAVNNNDASNPETTDKNDEEVEPENDVQTQTDSDGEEKADLLWLWITIGAVVVLGAVVVVILIKKKK